LAELEMEEDDDGDVPCCIGMDAVLAEQEDFLRQLRDATPKNISPKRKWPGVIRSAGPTDPIYRSGLTVSSVHRPSGDAEEVPLPTKPDRTAKDSDPK